MKDRLTPDYMFGSYREITPEFLDGIGVRGLLIDIDNTLAPYEQPDPDDDLRAWFANLSAHGICAALVSNNHRERVERFNETLGLYAIYDSHKPRRAALLRAMQAIGTDLSDTAVLGDQLLTDAYAGKHIGLPALIVPPIRDKRNLFFRFKRLCERRYIRKFAKKNGYRAYLAFWKIKAPKNRKGEDK